MFKFQIIDALTDKVAYECFVARSKKVRIIAQVVNSGYFMAGLNGVHPDGHCVHRVTSV